MKKLNLSTSNFKRFFLLTGMSVCLLWAFVLIANGLFEKYVVLNSEISGASKIHRIIHETHPDEIPIFGSSRANCSFVPSVLGENFRNYGIDGTHANVWLFFLEEELKKKKSTPIIVNFDLEGMQSSIGNINNYIPNSDNRGVKDIVEAYGKKLPSGLFRYYGKFESYVKYNLNESISLTKMVDNGGVFTTEPLTKEKFDALVLKRMETRTAFLINDTLYQRLVSLIQSTDRRIIFVVCPYHPSYFNKFANLETVEVYKSMLQKFDNVNFWDFSKVSMPEDGFINTSHLNYNGAKQFTSLLKKRWDLEIQ